MKAAMKFSFAALCASLAVLPSDVSATKASLVDDVCTHNTYMCCWTENDNGVEDNTDVCRVTNFSGTEVEYPNDEEGDTHCHGFVWAEDASFESFILPLYKFVRTFDHRDARGYYGRIKGAPQCECIEKMPVVTRADCTTYSSQGLTACEDNDLRTHYDGEMNKPGGNLDFNLVGDCNQSEGGGGNGGGNGSDDKDKSSESFSSESSSKKRSNSMDSSSSGQDSGYTDKVTSAEGGGATSEEDDGSGSMTGERGSGNSSGFDSSSKASEDSGSAERRRRSSSEAGKDTASASSMSSESPDSGEHGSTSLRGSGGGGGSSNSDSSEDGMSSSSSSDEGNGNGSGNGSGDGDY